MSRIGKQAVTVPAGVTLNQDGQKVTVKGSKGTLTQAIHPDVSVAQEDAALKASKALSAPLKLSRLSDTGSTD